MTEHTEAAEQRHEQAPPGSVPTLDLRFPAATRELRGAPPPPATVSPCEGIHGEIDPLVAAVCYQAWDWPVTACSHQVWLTLEPDTVALTIPVLLAAQVTGILNHHRSLTTVINPETPEHWVLLAGRCAEGVLPWPTWVHRATGTLALPPTMTAHGPITWTHPPEADARRRYREFDVFAALRTALRDQPT